MTDRDLDRLLMEASRHLSNAVRALQDAGERELCDRAFVLANDIVKARQPKRESIGATVLDTLFVFERQRNHA